MSRGGGGGRPVPGRPYYTRRDDEDATDIAIEAYGDPAKGVHIWDANKIKQGVKIPKGTKIIIPGEQPPTLITGRAADQLTVTVGGVELQMLSCKITRTMDTGADGWAGRIAWTPGEHPEVDRVTRPYGYERCAAYIGNDLQIAGCLYLTGPEMTTEGMTKELIGYSFTADAIDSHVFPPLEFANVTMKQLAKRFADSLGIKAHFEGTWHEGKFAVATANEGESIFSFLSKLAAQRGGLLSCTAQGDMLFHRARTAQRPVGVLEEGDCIVPGWKAAYDGRKRFYAYRCITAGPKGRSKTIHNWKDGPTKPGPTEKAKGTTITEFDKEVPRSRFQTFRADDTTPGNIQHAARWRRNRQFVDALTITLPVVGWLAPNGKPWECNTTVTVRSTMLGVPQGFTFLIRQVDFELDSRGRVATLSLVPPEAYTGKDIGNIWKY